MIVDLREFERFPATTILEAAPGEFESFAAEVAGVNWVQAKLNLQKTEHEYFCAATTRAEVVMVCARCAREYQTELEYDANFIIRSDASPVDAEREVADDEEYVYYHGNDLRVDLFEQIRQALILAIGMKPLCRPDCKGLCPVCGANWNESTCGCAQPASDSRWDGLRRLMDNNN